MSDVSFVNGRYANAPGPPIRELKRFTELPGMICVRHTKSQTPGWPNAGACDGHHEVRTAWRSYVRRCWTVGCANSLLEAQIFSTPD